MNILKAKHVHEPLAKRSLKLLFRHHLKVGYCHTKMDSSAYLQRAIFTSHALFTVNIINLCSLIELDLNIINKFKVVILK